MKKVFSIVALVCLCIGLTGCGDSKPSGMDGDLYETSIKALSVTDKYLDADIDANEAVEKLEIFEALTDRDYENTDDMLVQGWISNITGAIRLAKYDNDRIPMVKDSRDALAKLIRE